MSKGQTVVDTVEVKQKQKEEPDSRFGQIPESWRVKKIRNVAKVVGGSTPSTDNEAYWGGEIPWATPTDITKLRGPKISETSSTITKEGLGAASTYVLPAYSVLMTSRATIGACAVNTVPMATNQGFQSLIPGDGLNTWYLFYQILNQASYLESLGAGSTFSEVSKSVVEKVEIPVPPPDEQREIASVLLTVDRAIQATEAIIAQAKRVKRGLMQDVLIGGINEDGQIRNPESHPTQFRDTALGKVPKEWKMHPLSELCVEVVDSPHSTPIYSEDGVLIVRTSDIREGRFKSDEARCIAEKDYQDRISRLEPQPGDVVFTREAPVGEAFKITEGTRLCLGQRTMVFRTQPDLLDPDFLVHSIYSNRVQNRFDQLVVGTTNPHLNVGAIRKFKLPVPSLEEQKQIVNVLNSFDDRIDNENARKENLLRLKKGLMQDLLTGRVRTAGTNIDVLDEVQAHG